MERDGSISISLNGLPLTDRATLALRAGPRVLLILVVFVPAVILYADLAEHVGALRSCGSVRSTTILLATYFPTSVVLAAAGFTAAVFLLALNARNVAAFLALGLALNALPFVGGC